MNNILITSGGRRVSLVRAFKKELSEIFPNSKIMVADSFVELSAAAQVADQSFTVPKIDSGDYIEDLLSICLANGIKIIIPTLDTELALISRSTQLFISNNIHPIISDLNIIETFSDKLKTQAFFENLNIKVAEIYSKTKYKLPLFIKPYNGSNSKETYIIKHENDFTKNHFLNEDLIFFEYLDHDIYNEYTCDLYYDFNGNLKCVVPRLRLEIRGGEVSKGITKKNYLVTYIYSLLDGIKGMRGCVTIQFFMHKINNSIVGIEINPRFGGGYPLSYLAGANFPKWIIKEYLLNEKIETYANWEEDLLMLRYDEEIIIHGYKQ